MKIIVKGLMLGCFALAGVPAMGCELEGQWGSKVIAFSSEFGPGSWSARQILGPCDEPNYRDGKLTWNASTKDRGVEWIEVEFPQAVYPSGVIIRETYTPGFVRKIELKLLDGTYVTAWQGTSYPVIPNTVNDSKFLWETGGDLSKTVRVTIDTTFGKDKFEAIDSIQLLGPPTYSF